MGKGTPGNQGTPKKKPVVNAPAARQELHPRSIATYLRSLGLIGILLGGAGMVLTGFFWCAAIFIYLGLGVALFDIWIAEDLPKWASGLFSVLVIALLGLFTAGIVMYPPSLEIVVHAADGDYSTGQNIDGIDWKPGYSELRVALTNHSDRDYDNLDMRLRPDVWVARVVQTSHLEGVSFPDEETSVMSVVGHGIDPKTGKPVDQPFTMGPRNTGVRVRCDKVPRHSSLQLLIATMHPTSPITGAPDVVPDKKVHTNQLHVVGDYMITWRPRHIDSIHQAN